MWLVTLVSGCGKGGDHQGLRGERHAVVVAVVRPRVLDAIATTTEA